MGIQTAASKKYELINKAILYDDNELSISSL